MNRNDYAHVILLFRTMERLGIFEFEMSQDQSWRGGGYFWPRS